jgi:predicted PurR-regulated permease PerM
VFLLFFTILGGLRVYGVLGIFLGPIILAMGMAFLAIYKEIYLKQPAIEKKETGKAKEEPHPVSTGV